MSQLFSRKNKIGARKDSGQLCGDAMIENKSTRGPQAGIPAVVCRIWARYPNTLFQTIAGSSISAGMYVTSATTPAINKNRKRFRQSGMKKTSAGIVRTIGSLIHKLTPSEIAATRNLFCDNNQTQSTRKNATAESVLP